MHTFGVRSGARVKLFVPQLPRLRYVLSGWGILLAGIFGAVSLANVRHDVDTATVTAAFTLFALWAARRWWRLGAAIGAHRIIFRDMLRSRSFPRAAVEAVAPAERSTPIWRRLCLGDWMMTHELVVHLTEGEPRPRAGLLFSSHDAAALFATQVNAALTEASRSIS